MSECSIRCAIGTRCNVKLHASNVCVCVSWRVDALESRRIKTRYRDKGQEGFARNGQRIYPAAKIDCIVMDTRCEEGSLVLSGNPSSSSSSGWVSAERYRFPRSNNEIAIIYAPKGHSLHGIFQLSTSGRSRK